MKIRRVSLYDVSVPFGDTAYTASRQNCLPPLTAYHVMKIGAPPLIK